MKIFCRLQRSRVPFCKKAMWPGSKGTSTREKQLSIIRDLNPTSTVIWILSITLKSFEEYPERLPCGRKSWKTPSVVCLISCGKGHSMKLSVPWEVYHIISVVHYPVCSWGNSWQNQMRDIMQNERSVLFKIIKVTKSRKKLKNSSRLKETKTISELSDEAWSSMTSWTRKNEVI